MGVRWIAVVPSWLLLVAAASAQQTQAPAAPAGSAPAGAGAAQTAQPAAEAKPVAPEDMVSEGEAVLRRGNLVSAAVRDMLDEARKDADIIRVTCLDDKLTQINANLRSVETRLEALRKAVDPDRRTHEHTVLTVLAQKLQVLDQEAHQCVGQAMYETGQTKVLTEIDTDSLPFEETPSTPPAVQPPTLPTLPPATVVATAMR
jgi:hypothetical protein